MRSSLNRVKEVVAKVRHIQEESLTKGEAGAKYITDRCGAIAKLEDARLNVEVDKKTGELTSTPKCSYRYYSQLMEDYRNGVKALNYKHHAIEYHVNSFINKYQDTIEGIEKLLDIKQPIQKLRDNLIVLRSKAIKGSQYRKDLLSLKIEHHAYYMFETKGAIKDWISDDNKKALNIKLHSQILVNPNWVKETCHYLLTQETPSVSDLVIGITMATGRRPTEVLKTAKFKKVANNEVSFTGQLKTKNRHLFEEIDAYTIPTLIEADIVIEALKRLRKATRKDTVKYTNALGETVESTVSKGDIKDYYHNRAVQKKYETTINRAVRSLLQNGHFSIKDCRALYTEVTYSQHKNEGETRSAYRHRVLGHALIETQLHYDSFELDTSVANIKMCEKTESDGADKDVQTVETPIDNPLLVYLSKADADVKAYLRAPKTLVMHEWLKNEVSKGLEVEKIKASFVRRFCLVDGKQLNLNVIKGYLGEQPGMIKNKNGEKVPYVYEGPTIKINDFNTWLENKNTVEELEELEQDKEGEVSKK